MNAPLLPAPRAILWDWDNTLVDSWPTIGAALNETLAAFSLPVWTDAEVRGRVRHSLRDSFPALFGTEWERARDIYLDAFARRHLERLALLAGAQAALDAAAGRYMAVVSNKTGPFLRREAAHLRLDRHFAALVGAGDASADKPDPAAIRLGLGQHTTGPDVWYVGDTGLDMDAARAAGCTAVLVGAAEHEGGPAQCRPDLHFPDLTALAAALASGGGGAG